MDPILILTAPKDVHARAVQWMLRRRGFDCEILMGTDFPTKTQISVHVSSADALHDNVMVEGPEFRKKSDERRVAALWRRRLANPLLEDIHPSDSFIAERECKAFNSGLGYMLDSISDFCVNPHMGSLRASSKIEQLRCARDVGLRIPDTLTSNSPDEIRSFARVYEGEVIIKAFFTPTWSNSSKAWCGYATRVPEAILKNQDVLAACPAIYQQLVKKKYEIRCFFVGATCFAVRLNSQAIPRAKNDWRAARTALLDVEECEVPDHIREKCVALMSELGIVTGSFDFAVTTDDEYIFFEVNEQGQFLWMEERCPSLPVLRAFCDFLESKDPLFRMGTAIPDTEESFQGYVRSGAWESTVSEESEMHNMPGKVAVGVESESS